MGTRARIGNNTNWCTLTRSTGRSFDDIANNQVQIIHVDYEGWDYLIRQGMHVGAIINIADEGQTEPTNIIQRLIKEMYVDDRAIKVG